VGALTAAMEAIRAASSKSWRIIASHRSGETKDDSLADFSIGIEADAIKAGANIRVIRNSELTDLTADETRRISYIVMVVDQYNSALRI
jgi:enolase